MSDSVSDSANERSSQYDAPLPEKRITFDSRAQENNAGPSKIPVARAMRIPCVTQSSGDSNQKFQRLSSNRLTTLQRFVADFIMSREGMSIFTVNCQSLRKHAPDLQDSIVKNSNFLLLSETWLPDGENVDIPDFDCIVQFKRQNVRAAGVAIYQNRNALNITTSHMDVRIQNAREVDVGHTAVGDLCATQIVMVDGRELVMVVVYISPNQKIADIIKFLHRRLIIYSPAGSMLLQENFHKLPLILAGDFNTNFATEESLPLITFLQTEFQLVMNNHAQDSTTRYGTTIDAVFARYLENIESKTFITYFSYHRPIVTFIESNATVTEITDETSN